VETVLVGGEEFMRVGVVGCGYWGSKHVRVLYGLSDVTGVAIIDRDRERLGALKTAFPDAAEFTSLGDALPDVDALVVATPPASHARVALEAIRAGKHVLIEKPFTTSSSDARRLIAEARAADVTLMVGHTFEHNAAVWRLREAASSGELGKLHYLHSARLSLGAYQPDINVLWDLACHDVSIANFVLSSEPNAVSAWGAAHAHSALEDVATMRLDYDEIGVVATIRVSWLDPCKVRQTTLVGSEKMAVYDDLNDNERLKLYDRGVNLPEDATSVHAMPTTYRYGDVVSPYIDFHEPLQEEDRHFVECIRDKIEPSTSGPVGLAVVRVIEAAQESLRTGRTVALPTNGARLAVVGS